MIQSVITGTGSYIPETIVNNSSFLDAEFFGRDGNKLYQSTRAIIDKFKSVTGIEERRYSRPDQNASDLGYNAAVEAIAASGIDKESLDYIIVAHNFGDVSFETNRVNQVPSLGSRIKTLLQINNPDCIAYDVAFGCPGWVEAVIQAIEKIQSITERGALQNGGGAKILDLIHTALAVGKGSDSRLQMVRDLGKFLQELSYEPKRIATGFVALDRALEGGVEPGLHVIAGDPKLGKTTFLTQVGVGGARRGETVWNISGIHQKKPHHPRSTGSPLCSCLEDPAWKGQKIHILSIPYLLWYCCLF